MASARLRALPATLAVALHVGAIAWHGAAHAEAGDPLPSWRTTYLLLVGSIAPLCALLLMWSGRLGGGAALLALAMVATLAADLIQHFGGAGPESVADHPTLRPTATVLVMTASLALAVAGLMARKAARQA